MLAGGSNGEREGLPEVVEARVVGTDVERAVGHVLEARAEYAGFDDFWEPFTLAVGPAGQCLMSLPSEQQAAVREACRVEVPDGPFSLTARAWYATGSVPT